MEMYSYMTKYEIENMDISNFKLDNKLYNLQYIMNPNVFKFLALHTNSITDTSIAYIPNNFVKLNEKEEKMFVSSRAENNYADISFINCGVYYNIKACRIKSFEAIPLDGNMLTYHSDAMNNHTFILFYSINPNEFGKLMIITTETYDKLASMNGNEHLRYFNASDSAKIRDALGLKVSDIFYTDNLNEYLKTVNIPTECLTNIEIKKKHCNITLMHYEIYKANNNGRLISQRTHHGKQYSAYNIVTGEMRTFRDCYARNNFFKLKGINIPSNNTVNHNCNNMDNIVTKKNKYTYKINLFNNGWIVTNYIPNHAELAVFVQSLLSIIHSESKRISLKIERIIANCKQQFILMTNSAKVKIKLLKNKLRKKINYFRPLYVLEFVTSNHNENKKLPLKYLKI